MLSKTESLLIDWSKDNYTGTCVGDINNFNELKVYCAENEILFAENTIVLNHISKQKIESKFPNIKFVEVRPTVDLDFKSLYPQIVHTHSDLNIRQSRRISNELHDIIVMGHYPWDNKDFDGDELNLMIPPSLPKDVPVKSNNSEIKKETEKALLKDVISDNLIGSEKIKARLRKKQLANKSKNK